MWDKGRHGCLHANMGTDLPLSRAELEFFQGQNSTLSDFFNANSMPSYSLACQNRCASPVPQQDLGLVACHILRSARALSRGRHRQGPPSPKPARRWRAKVDNEINHKYFIHLISVCYRKFVTNLHQNEKNFTKLFLTVCTASFSLFLKFRKAETGRSH